MARPPNELINHHRQPHRWAYRQAGHGKAVTHHRPDRLATVGREYHRKRHGEWRCPLTGKRLVNHTRAARDRHADKRAWDLV